MLLSSREVYHAQLASGAGDALWVGYAGFVTTQPVLTPSGKTATVLGLRRDDEFKPRYATVAVEQADTPDSKTYRVVYDRGQTPVFLTLRRLTAESYVAAGGVPFGGDMFSTPFLHAALLDELEGDATFNPDEVLFTPEELRDAVRFSE